MSKKFIAPLLIGSILVFLFVLIAIKFSANSTTDENLSLEKSSGYVGLTFQTSKVEPNTGTIWVNASPRLSGPAGYVLQNGSFANMNLVYGFDVFYGDSTLTVTKNTIVGGKTIPLRLIGNVDQYPFDKYTASTFVTVQQRIGFSDEQLSSSLDLADQVSKISGMVIETEQLPYKTQKSDTVDGNMREGVGQISWSIKRSISNQILVILIGMLMVIGLIVSTLITRAILKGTRPPSMNALAWLAAFLFALFSIRNQMPGSPPSGVMFDRWIFYPVIFGLVALVAINVISWITRPDWDMENPMYAVLGKVPEESQQNNL